jgi:AraC family transcriptional regulator of adaptative response / DNA-3-methyladenine glycosylase II
MEIELRHRRPIDARALLRFLGGRAVPGVEEVRDGSYRRSLRLASGPAVIEVRVADGVMLANHEQAARAVFDLDADPEAIADALGSDPLIGDRVRANPGLRVPGHADPAELAVRAVIGQQVSVAAARTIAGRLVAAYGEPLDRPVGSVTHLFPTPAVLAALSPEDLPMPRARARALTGLAAALAGGELVLGRDALLALPGIGPWTASYVAMRALGDPDAFLPTDLGVRRALERLGVDGSPAAAQATAERWRPYRAYALQHLWTTLNEEARR